MKRWKSIRMQICRSRIRRLTLVLLFMFLSAYLLSADGPGVPALAQGSETADWRFGVIESYEDPAAAGALGVAWTRVIFHWAEVQPGGAGTWSAKVSDEQINSELNAGRQVVGLLIGIPGWAIDGNGLPRGLWSPHGDPANAWATFVREAVSRYQGRINHWIIWNEPDIGQGAVAHTWNGSVNDFFQLQRVAYLVAKEVNPSSIIHLSAFTYWADANAGREQYMARLLDQILADPAAAGHNFYFDVATAHLYFQTTQVFDLTQFFLGLMRQRGMSQPIWLMETNLPPFDDPVWPVANPFLKATLMEQAAFMPQVIASALAAGAQRIAIYKLRDTITDQAANPEPFGLVRSDGNRRPAFETYRLATRYLRGMTGVRRERWDAVGQIRIDQGQGSTTVLFSRLPAPQLAQVAAKGSTALLVDMWGVQRSIAAVDGVFSVQLPGAPCTQTIGAYCMVGGTTYYLVQSGEVEVTPPSPTATPTATATATSTPTVTPSVTATASPTVTPSATATPSPTTPPTGTATDTATPNATDTPKPAASATAALAGQPEAASTASAPDTEDSKGPATGLFEDKLSYWLVGIDLLLALVLLTLILISWRRGRT